MTTSKLPEITLICRNGHPFTTTARGKSTVRCKTCGVPKGVPVNRPRTAREVAAASRSAAGDEDQDQGEAQPLAARWDAEPGWDGHLRPVPGRAGDECPECSGPLMWEPGRTQTLCDPCKRVYLPAAVARHYDRQARQRAEVAVRTEPDRAVQRAGRARLRALKDEARRRVNDWIETVADEDSHDRIQWQQQARELAAMLRGYLPEIVNAGDEAELAEVWRAIDGLVTSEQGQALRVEYDEGQQRAERQRQAQQHEAEYAQRQQELAEQQEREAREAERAERLAIASPTEADGDHETVLEKKAAQRARLIERNGHCEFPHSWLTPPATRRVTGWNTDYRQASGGDTETCLCCGKCQGKAVAYITKKWRLHEVEDISGEEESRVIVQRSMSRRR